MQMWECKHLQFSILIKHCRNSDSVHFFERRGCHFCKYERFFCLFLWEVLIFLPINYKHFWHSFNTMAKAGSYISIHTYVSFLQLIHQGWGEAGASILYLQKLIFIKPCFWRLHKTLFESYEVLDYRVCILNSVVEGSRRKLVNAFAAVGQRICNIKPGNLNDTPALA